MNNNNIEREFGWDDEISKDNNGEYILLPEGNYLFKVEGFERARYTPKPGAKLPACNQAIVKLLIETNKGDVFIYYNLYLHSIMEGMLSAFFGAIGLKKKGEPLKMNWNQIIGKEGVCKIGPKVYNNNTYNDVKKMIYLDDIDLNSLRNGEAVTTLGTNFTTTKNDIPW